MAILPHLPEGPAQKSEEMSEQHISIEQHAQLLEKYEAALNEVMAGLQEYNALVERYQKVKAQARAGLCEIGLAAVDGNTELAYALIEGLLVELEKI